MPQRNRREKLRERVPMTMKSLTIATLVLIASLTTAYGQVKSVAAANNHVSAKPVTTSQNPANTTRVRVVGEQPGLTSESGNALGDATVTAHAKSGLNNHSDSARLSSISTAAKNPTPTTSNDHWRIGHTSLKPVTSAKAACLSIHYSVVQSLWLG